MKIQLDAATLPNDSQHIRYNLVSDPQQWKEGYYNKTEGIVTETLEGGSFDTIYSILEWETILGTQGDKAKAEFSDRVKKILTDMCDTLFVAYNELNLRPNDMQYISEDVEYVEVNFLGKEPDSDYSHEAKTEEGMTAAEAVEMLSARLKNVLERL